MLRTKLPWLFTALAVASPPLLWVLREPIRLWLEEGYERQAGTFAAILWFFFAVTAVLMFAVVGLATSTSQSQGKVDLRRAALLTVGAVSVAAGILTLTYLNLLVKEWGFRPFLIEWAPGGLMLAAGLFAIREWRRGRRSGGNVVVRFPSR